MEKILATTISALLIGFIVWWFFRKQKTNTAEAITKENKQEIEVIVSGGYTPNIVLLKKGTPAKIIFNRKDPSGCFNEVVFPDFGINEHLPVNKKHSININTNESGEYQYSCGMNMFHGKIIIK